MILMFGRCRC